MADSNFPEMVLRFDWRDRIGTVMLGVRSVTEHGRPGPGTRGRVAREQLCLSHQGPVCRRN